MNVGNTLYFSDKQLLFSHYLSYMFMLALITSCFAE